MTTEFYDARRVPSDVTAVFIRMAKGSDQETPITTLRKVGRSILACLDPLNYSRPGELAHTINYENTRGESARGVNRFRKLLGLEYTTGPINASLDDLAFAMYELGGVSSQETAKNIIPSLLGKELIYGNDKVMTIRENKDKPGYFSLTTCVTDTQGGVY